MKPSLTSQFFARILKAGKFKKLVERKADKPIKRSDKGFLPNRFKRSYSWHLQTSQAKELATFESKNKVTKTPTIFGMKVMVCSLI